MTLGLLYTFKLAEDFSRAWVFFWFTSAALSLAYTRSRCHVWLRRNVHNGQLRRRVALVGYAKFVQEISDHLASTCPLSEVGGRFVVGTCDDSGLFNGRIEDLERELAAGRFDQVIICILSLIHISEPTRPY